MHLLHQLKKSHVVSWMLSGFAFFSIQMLIFNQINVFTIAFEISMMKHFLAQRNIVDILSQIS